MTAESLMKRYAMLPHVENGAFVERHYEHPGEGRPASGAIYYYVAAGETTEFHQIDCDEYWCYAAGAQLEVWQADRNGTVVVKKLGVEEGCDPMLYIPKGTVFAAKHAAAAEDGTFVTCITVPRFSYDGFTMLPRETVVKRYPALGRFFAEAEAVAPTE